MRPLIGVLLLTLLSIPSAALARFDLGPTPDNVLFIPGTEASRLYMKDANGTERQLWEPSFHTDIPLLAMNPDGTSVNEIYTKDIINSLYGNDPFYQFGAGVLSQQDLDTYGRFETFMAAVLF